VHHDARRHRVQQQHVRDLDAVEIVDRDRVTAVGDASGSCAGCSS
jgi:hypothetical protein